MLLAKDFRKTARDALSGNWGVAVLVGLVASILGVGTNSSPAPNAQDNIDKLNSNFLNTIPSYVLTFAFVVLTIISIMFVVKLVIGGAIKLGYCEFNLKLISRNNPTFSDLFSKFHMFGRAFLLNLLITIFTTLWTMLFVIPGIVASYRYSMAFYLLNENPEMTAMEAIRESKRIMQGNKSRLFCLDFSFIGWAVLSFLTCGLGVLWLAPYVEASHASFYLDLKNQQKSAAVEVNA